MLQAFYEHSILYKEENVIVLYHGTTLKSAISSYKEGINIRAGKQKTDFGPGFYMTDDYDRAVKWAKRKAIAQLDRAAIVTADFCNEHAPIKHFEDGLEWGRFIINNRNGLRYINQIPYKENNLFGIYPITKGRIADISVNDAAACLMKSNEMLNSIESIYNSAYPLQWAFHTEEALLYLKNIRYRIL